tara:strand:- start:102 stop:398 length:297 start_codon:yes stop_codon:yes gene_type:complete
MEKRSNPFMRKSKDNSHFKPNTSNNRWSQIREEVQEIEYNNRMERMEENKFKKYNNQNQRNHYSKFMRFTDKKEVKEEPKPEFNLQKMENDFPQLGSK